MAAQVAALPHIIIELLFLTLIHAGNDHKSSGTILTTQLPPHHLVLWIVTMVLTSLYGCNRIVQNVNCRIDFCSRVKFTIGSRSDGSPRCNVDTLQSCLLEGAGTVCVVNRLRSSQCAVPVPGSGTWFIFTKISRLALRTANLPLVKWWKEKSPSSKRRAAKACGQPLSSG
jgi:hypothetical protein